MNTRALCLALPGLLLVALTATAQSLIVTEEELAPDRFPDVAAQIRDNLDQIGLSSARREQVLQLLQRMETRIAEDPERHHWRIRQEQRRLNTALGPDLTVNERGAKVVCRRIRPVGSKIPITECRDRQTIETEQDAAVRMLDRAGVDSIKRDRN
jgi:hypothetical protein